MRAASGVSALIFGPENGVKVTPVSALLSSSPTGVNDSPAASAGAPRVLAPALLAGCLIGFLRQREAQDLWSSHNLQG
jgi:hypothetical protein